MPAEVANQREVPLGAKFAWRTIVGRGRLQFAHRVFRKREVVMHAGYRLHAGSVPAREARPVNRLQPADVRCAVAADRDVIVRGEPARHAARPQRVIADVPVDELVNLRQFREARVHVGLHAGDELHLRLAEVRRDVRMRERCAELRRMRRDRQRAIGPDPQALLLDATQQAFQRIARKRVQSMFRMRQAPFSPESASRRRPHAASDLRGRPSWTNVPATATSVALCLPHAGGGRNLPSGVPLGFQ